MMKIKILNTILLVAVCFATLAQNADEVLKKHFAATGQDKIKELKTISMSMNIKTGGMEMPMTTFVKKPNSYLVEMTMQGQKMTIGFDGQKGWMLNPMMGSDPVEMPESQLAQFKNQSNFEQLGFFSDYKEQGHKAEYLGKENVNNKPAHKIKLNKKNGDVIVMFIDVASNMVIKQNVKTKMMDKEFEAETFLSDFKKVDTFIIPHTVEVKSPSQTAPTTMTITKIEINKPVDDAKFKMPAK